MPPRDFPGGPVVKTLPSSAGGAGLIPGQGARVPHASWPKKKKSHLKKFVPFTFGKIIHRMKTKHAFTPS